MAFNKLDLESLRLSQNFDTMTGAKKVLLSVPLRKPHKHEWVRTRADWTFPAPVLKMRGDRQDDLYVVAAPLVSVLPDEVVPMLFSAYVTRQDTFSLWPVRLPDPDGRHDDWSRTAMEAASLAQSRWIRVAANRHLGSYEVFEPATTFPEPTWPELDWPAVLQIAFKDHVIDDVDHPALRRLRGEV